MGMNKYEAQERAKEIGTLLATVEDMIHDIDQTLIKCDKFLMEGGAE